MPNYWAVVANPKIYDIEKAIQNLEFDYWTIKQSKVSKGDHILIWKSLGYSAKRGIICFGEVLSNPRIMPDLNKTYWLDKQRADVTELRVKVRYYKKPNLPLWLGSNYDDTLNELSVTRATGGTVFKVTPEQWEKIMAITGNVVPVPTSDDINMDI